MSTSKYKWVVGRTARTIARKFSASAKAIPTKAWQQWAIALGIGLIICILLMLLITLWAMNSPALQTWDEQNLPLVVKNLPMSFDKGVTWQSPGNLVGMLPVVVAVAALTSWFARPLIAATVVTAYILQFAIVWVGWGVWNRDLAKRAVARSPRADRRWFGCTRLTFFSFWS